MPLENLENGGTGLDISSIADSIGQEFGSEPTSPPQQVQSGEGGQPGAQPGSPVAPGNPASPPANLPQLKALPKAWKKEMQAYWEKLDPAVHDYVYQREADVMRGIQQYQEGHKRWSDLTTPFQQILEQNPGVDPIALFQTLARNHLALVQAPEAQKAQLAMKLLAQYGLDPSKLTGSGSQPASQPQTDPQIAAALQRLERLEGHISQSQKLAQQAELEKSIKQVEAFFGDKEKYPFAEDAMDDIQQLLASRAADSLERAYEMAIWTNPAIREKVLAAQQAASAKPGPKLPNLESSGAAKPTSPAGKGNWMDDIDEIAQNAFKH